MLDVEELRETWSTARSWRTCGRSAGSRADGEHRDPAARRRSAVPGSGKPADEDDAGAAAARNALHGRKFGGNVVKADFIDEAVFASRAF